MHSNITYTDVFRIAF